MPSDNESNLRKMADPHALEPYVILRTQAAAWAVGEIDRLRREVYSYPPNPPFAPDGYTYKQAWEAAREVIEAQQEVIGALKGGREIGGKHPEVPDRYGLTTLGKAAFLHALSELQRVYWNIHQEDWADWSQGQIGQVKWKGYYWGDDEKEAEKPNFEACGLRLWWYKYPGRGMECDRSMGAEDWAAWLEKVCENLHEADLEDDRREEAGGVPGEA